MIDQQALVAALADKTIAGAGLDVYEKEPHAPDALTAFPNVVLTPHVGGHTLESHVAMQDCVMANLEAFLPANRCLMRFGAPKSAISAQIWPKLKPAACRDFSPWQAGKDSLNNRFRACWPLLARLCSHSENPIR